MSDFSKDGLSLSIGYTDFKDSLKLDELIQQADKALYYAKEHGRNALHKYQKLMKKGLLKKDTKSD